MNGQGRRRVCWPPAACRDTGTAMRDTLGGRRPQPRIATAGLIGLVTIAVLATAPVSPVWGGGFGCCQCDCSSGPLCAEGPENTCASFCAEDSCPIGSYTEGAECADVPACSAASETKAVPALGHLALIAAALGTLAVGMRRLRRRMR